MKKTIMFVLAAAFSIASVRAQQSITPKNPVALRYQEPAQPEPDTLAKIFSNLGKGTTEYNNAAWIVRGPGAAGGSQFIGMPFTPKQNAHVEQVHAAVQYNAAGANQVNLSLYSDSNGAPGVLLAGPVTVTNVPTYPSCCKLAIAHFPTSVAVTAGTQYWVVANTPTSGTGSDFSGTWNYVPPSKFKVAASGGGGPWFSFQATTQEPAGSVYGTIP